VVPAPRFDVLDCDFFGFEPLTVVAGVVRELEVVRAEVFVDFVVCAPESADRTVFDVLRLLDVEVDFGFVTGCEVFRFVPEPEDLDVCGFFRRSRTMLTTVLRMLPQLVLATPTLYLESGLLKER